MTIPLIISTDLFRAFDYKYNIEIIFLFPVMSCWLAVTWAVVPESEPSFRQLSSAPSSHTLRFGQSWVGAELSRAPATLPDRVLALYEPYMVSFVALTILAYDFTRYTFTLFQYNCIVKVGRKNLQS